MRSAIPMTVVCALAMALFLTCPVNAQKAEDSGGKQFMLNPIGTVQKEDGRTLLVLNKKFEPGLKGLEGFSHIQVFWWFDKNDTPKKRATMQVHPRGNKKNPLTGVFATRSPRRPNLIALTLCRVISIRDNGIEVKKIDAFAGTPILDIKPYIPGYDSTAGASVPDWVKKLDKKDS